MTRLVLLLSVTCALGGAPAFAGEESGPRQDHPSPLIERVEWRYVDRYPGPPRWDRYGWSDDRYGGPRGPYAQWGYRPLTAWPYAGRPPYAPYGYYPRYDRRTGAAEFRPWRPRTYRPETWRRPLLPAAAEGPREL